MRLVELHHAHDGSPVSINPHHVVLVNADEQGQARIFLNGGNPEENYITVKETYPIACQMLED